MKPRTTLRGLGDCRSGQGRSHPHLLRLLAAVATVSVGLPTLTVSVAAGTAAASEAGGPAWKIQPALAPNLPNGVISAVSCTDLTACVGVGFFIDPAGRQLTLVERWDGTSWVVQTSPNPKGAASSLLSGVSCTSATACIAVGLSIYPTVNGAHQGTLVEGWDGTSWSIQSTPNPTGATSGLLSGVSCTSPTACTAVGSFATSTVDAVTLAERWNGTSWSIQTTPNTASSESQTLYGVSCISATACTAVGSSSNDRMTLAEPWNGTSWSIQTTPNIAGTFTNVLDGVSCSSATACTAVGYFVNGSHGRVTLAERWNGTSWSVQTTPPNPKGVTDSSLDSVSCTSATACTAVGFPDNDAQVGTLAERWNGTSWSIQSTPNPPPNGLGRLIGVSCTSAVACTAVGSTVPNFRVQSSSATVAEHWDGTRWSIQSTPNPAGATYNAGVRAVSCASPTACTAVGSFTDSTGRIVPLAERLDGTSWSVQSVPNPAGAGYSLLSGVSCTSATACTAVGSSSASFNSDGVTLAERWDGTSWSIQATPNPEGANGSALNGVSCTSATACIAVGSIANSSFRNVALAESWNGTSWSIQTTPQPSGAIGSNFNGVSCISGTACTAVGTFGTSGGGGGTLAERWNGTSWSIQTSPNPTGTDAFDLSAVSCASTTACTAVGLIIKGNLGQIEETFAERWNGTSWSIQTTPSLPSSGNGQLSGVSCTSTTACTAVGSFATSTANGMTLAERWNGTSWSIQSTPNPSSIYIAALRGVSCTSAAVCTATGYSAAETGTELMLIGSPLMERYS